MNLHPYRYETVLNIGDHSYLVSFTPKFQTISYVRTDGVDAGKFQVRNGWIGSKEPADFILHDEIVQEIEHQKTKLIVRH